MRVLIQGSDLPGRICRPDLSGHQHTNVHLGLCRRATSGSAPNLPGRTYGVEQLVRGDAEAARFELEISVRETNDGFDFGGPYVLGRRGDRHLGLAWGDVDGDSFTMFRGAKLRLDRIDPDVIRQAVERNQLRADLGLTDEKGNPRCATVRPAHIRWSADPA